MVSQLNVPNLHVFWGLGMQSYCLVGYENVTLSILVGSFD